MSVEQRLAILNQAFDFLLDSLKEADWSKRDRKFCREIDEIVTAVLSGDDLMIAENNPLKHVSQTGLDAIKSESFGRRLEEKRADTFRTWFVGAMAEAAELADPTR